MSNEQIAHDLTLLYVKEELKPSFEELQKGIAHKDICDLYLELYPHVLSKINDAYPKN